MYAKRAWYILLLFWLLKKLADTDADEIILERDRAKEDAAAARLAQSKAEDRLKEELRFRALAERQREAARQKAEEAAQEHARLLEFIQWDRLQPDYAARYQAFLDYRKTEQELERMERELEKARERQKDRGMEL